MDFRKAALGLLRENIQGQNLIKHNLAAGALMAELALYFGVPAEKDLWELSGLLHDVDWEKTATQSEEHGKVGEAIIREAEFPEEVALAVRRHNFMSGVEAPETLMEKALYYCEEITGLVVASALVLPSKKLVDVTPETVLKRFKEKAFARGVNRELLLEAPEHLEITLEKMAELAVRSMQNIHEDLGL
ncbi:MAG: HDIG domain-containing protein [Patescibacteria group bacterium]|nr:HDIG domain-containing protein [Patescibacteria group bacterium]